MRKTLLLLMLVAGCGKPGLEITGTTDFDKNNGDTITRFMVYNHTEKAVIAFDGNIVFADVFGDVIAKRNYKWDFDRIEPGDSCGMVKIFDPTEFSSKEIMPLVHAYSYKKLTTRFDVQRVVWE